MSTRLLTMDQIQFWLYPNQLRCNGLSRHSFETFLGHQQQSLGYWFKLLVENINRKHITIRVLFEDYTYRANHKWLLIRQLLVMWKAKWKRFRLEFVIKLKLKDLLMVLRWNEVLITPRRDNIVIPITWMYDFTPTTSSWWLSAAENLWLSTLIHEIMGLKLDILGHDVTKSIRCHKTYQNDPKIPPRWSRSNENASFRSFVTPEQIDSEYRTLIPWIWYKNSRDAWNRQNHFVWAPFKSLTDFNTICLSASHASWRYYGVLQRRWRSV